MSSIAYICFEPLATTGTKEAILERVYIYAPGEIMFKEHVARATYGDLTRSVEVEGYIWAYSIDKTGRLERNESAHERHIREMDTAFLRSMG